MLGGHLGVWLLLSVSALFVCVSLSQSVTCPCDGRKGKLPENPSKVCVKTLSERQLRSGRLWCSFLQKDSVLCENEWPSFKKGWLETQRSFRQSGQSGGLWQALLATLYADAWLTLAVHSSPWLKTCALSLGVGVLLVQPEHLKRLKNATGFPALSEEIEILSSYVLTGLTEYTRGARGNGHPPPLFMVYVSFTISDLCNWKTPQTLIFSEKPQALIILLETAS